MWAVLSDDTKKGGKWNEAEFFETGRTQISGELKKLRDAGIQLNWNRALDFGCGPGRLTQALADYFSVVDGLDISSSMIEKANALNKAPERIHYHVNPRSDLSVLASDSYDFIYSVIVLQHIPPEIQERYISEFIRLLKPGGVACFQTIHTHSWRACVPNWFVELYRAYKHRARAYIPMYGLPPHRVRGAISSRGGVLRHYEQGSLQSWESRFKADYFTALKPTG